MSDAFEPADPSATPPPTPMPPGWYDDGSGTQRYWDGGGWAEQVGGPVNQGYAAQTPAVATSSDDNTMAMLAHLLSIVSGFIGPLIIYLVKGNDSVYVKHHAAEALNFAITVFIAVSVSAILMIVLIGFLLLPVVMIGALILNVMAAMAANRGEWYTYPINLRLVPGAAV